MRRNHEESPDSCARDATHCVHRGTHLQPVPRRGHVQVLKAQSAWKIALVPKDAINAWFVQMEQGVKRYAKDTGISRISMMACADPSTMLAMELTVIAAVVFGGTCVTGGLGTLTGTILGIALMTIMANSLILIGIPTYWTRVFTGAVIIIGTAVTARQMATTRRWKHTRTNRRAGGPARPRPESHAPPHDARLRVRDDGRPPPR